MLMLTLQPHQSLQGKSMKMKEVFNSRISLALSLPKVETMKDPSCGVPSEYIGNTSDELLRALATLPGGNDNEVGLMDVLCDDEVIVD